MDRPAPRDSEISHAFAYVFAASAASAASTASPHPSTEEERREANACEISESLGPELYIQAISGKEDSGKYRWHFFPKRKPLFSDT